MSGKLKEIRGRINSVVNIQQITIAMKMVSASKLRKVQNRIFVFREYAEKLKKVTQDVIANIDTSNLAEELKLTQVRPVKNVLLIVITSDRGLCGSFNTNVIKKALHVIQTEYKHLDKKNITILPINKKAYDFFLKNKYNMISDYVETLKDINAENGAIVANRVMQGFLDKEWDNIKIIYSQFKNASVHNILAEDFLPISPETITAEKNIKKDYIFEPQPKQLLADLLPQTIITQFLRAVIDTSASEHGARMVAMEQASENAKELLKDLKLSYNKARQDAITMELSEIVSGASIS